MRRLRPHPVHTTLIAIGLALAAVVGIAAGYGFDAFAHAWSHVHPAWLALALAGELLAIPAYVLGYHTVAHLPDVPRLAPALLVRLVTAGFGLFALGGGFHLDKRVLHAVSGEEDVATVTALGLGALEWALLAPAAWLSAVVLLAVGDPRPMPSLLWPWAIAVPIGFALGLWLAAPTRRERLTDGHGVVRGRLNSALRGVGTLLELIRCLPRTGSAWIGMALFWSLDIAAFYGSLRFVGLRPNLGESILAYATGYALTRRSMPLGGAGVTEVLMTFALHWVGEPVAPALAAVVVYRVFNFALPAGPALVARRRLHPLLSAADQGDTAAAQEHRHAAEPLMR